MNVIARDQSWYPAGGWFAHMPKAQAVENRSLKSDATPRKMLAHERHADILRSLRTHGAIQVPAMASRLGVSEMTVRRDLVELEQGARLVRIHGGAIALNGPSIAMNNDEPSFEARVDRDGSAKAAIATAALELLAGCRTVGLDVGTTTYALAQRLIASPNLKIFTNNLQIATLLGDKGLEVYVAGGRLRPGERSITGAAAVTQFEQLWFDAAVIGVSGVTDEGFYDYSFEEVELKRVFLRRSGIKLVLCDSTKFRRMSLVHIGQLSEATAIVTNLEPPSEIRDALRSAKVALHIADALTT
jgi:DeoR/GlpR family transcriptional regulator of sugar metabolism